MIFNLINYILNRPLNLSVCTNWVGLLHPEELLSLHTLRNENAK